MDRLSLLAAVAAFLVVGSADAPSGRALGAEPAARDGTLAEEVLKASGTKAGLAVHLGVTDGRLTAELAANGKFLVHGLAAAGGKLYLTTLDGKLRCFGKK